MKGIMVSLLTLCMTGMVMGQQPRNSVNQFGNPFGNPDVSGQARSVLNGNSSSGASPATNPNSASQSGPLEMVLTDRLIEDFRTKGQLSAMIQPRQYVNEIIFLHENNSKLANISGKMIPISKGDETLRFELDEFDLRRIKQQGLKYSFDPFEQGRYKQVVVDYRASNSPTSKSPFQNTSSGNTTFGANQMGGSQPSSSYLPPPAPDYARPFDPSYMGPTIPRDLVANSNRRDSNSTTGNSNWPPASGPTKRATNSFGSQGNGFETGNRRQNASNNVTDRTASNSNWPNQNTPFTAPRLTDTPSKFQPINSAQNQGSNWNSSANRQSNVTNNSISDAKRQQDELDRRQAELVQRNLDLQKQKLAELEASNRLEEQAILEQRRSMEQVRADIARRNANGQGFDGRDRSGTRGFPSNQFDQQRLAANSSSNYSDQLLNGFGSPSSRRTDMNSPQPTSGGVRSMAASIQGPQNRSLDNGVRDAHGTGQRGNLLGDSENRNEEKTEGIIYFMLLFSLGLNVYLGWISRGFYVRYNELADELRETFTATM